MNINLKISDELAIKMAPTTYDLTIHREVREAIENHQKCLFDVASFED